MVKVLKYFWVFAFVLVGCSEETITKEKKTPQPKEVLVATPNISQDSLLTFVKNQVEFGPRVPNSPAHEKCANYLHERLKAYGFEVSEQTGQQVAHDGKTLGFRNIIGRFQPEKTKRILLTAHWDTRPWADQDDNNQQSPIDGANDGGSGVGVILEIARAMQQMPPNVGVDVVLFDIEDYGISDAPNSFCYGSQYFSQNNPFVGSMPQYGINLDMVGDRTATFVYEGFSMQYARPVLDKVWGAAHRLGYQRFFLREPSYPITDDHLWVNRAGIPCIDIIHKDIGTGSFPASWHTHDDDINNIDANTLYVVTNTLLQVIYRE